MWFDTPRRKTLGRLTTNGVGRFRGFGSSGIGNRRGGTVRREGWLLLGPGRGRRDGGGTEGWVLHPRVWFDTAFRKTPGRLTTNGMGASGGAVRTGWAGWVLGLCGSLRQAQGRLSGPPRDSGPAHHERVGASRSDGEPGIQRGRGGMVRREGWLLLGPPFDRLRAGSPGTPEWWMRRGEDV